MIKPNSVLAAEGNIFACVRELTCDLANCVRDVSVRSLGTVMVFAKENS